MVLRTETIFNLLFALALSVCYAASMRAQTTAAPVAQSTATDLKSTKPARRIPFKAKVPAPPVAPAPALSKGRGSTPGSTDQPKQHDNANSGSTAAPAIAKPQPAPSPTWSDNYFLIPAAGAVFAFLATLIYDRIIKRRLVIAVLSRHHIRTVDSLHGLYLQKIDPSERISPRYLTHCLDSPALCIRNPRHLWRLPSTTDLSASRHIVIAAKCQGDVVGFLKAIYLPATQVLYVAYSAVQDGESSLERRTMRKILNELRAFTILPTPVKWIAFEIANVDAKLAKAKERLFRQYAELFGVQLRRVGIEYLQPDLDCAEMSSNQELPSLLYLGAVGETPRSIEVDVLRQIIENMLFGMYVPTWLIDHPSQEAPALGAYARSVVDLVLTGAPARVALL